MRRFRGPGRASAPDPHVVSVSMSRRQGDERQEAEALIDALYTLSDIHAEVNALRAMAHRPLDTAEDIGLVDDVIDALLDPKQADHARPILREALAVIAKRALGET